MCQEHLYNIRFFFNLADKNKSFYKQYSRMFGHFKISLQADYVSSGFLVASLFYKCERYQEFFGIINYSLFISCTPDTCKIYLHRANSLAEQTVFKEMTHKFGLLHAFKYLRIENLCFLYPFDLLPNELTSLTDDSTCFIPTVVYSYIFYNFFVVIIFEIQKENIMRCKILNLL